MRYAKSITLIILLLSIVSLGIAGDIPAPFDKILAIAKDVPINEYGTYSIQSDKTENGLNISIMIVYVPVGRPNPHQIFILKIINDELNLSAGYLLDSQKYFKVIFTPFGPAIVYVDSVEVQKIANKLLAEYEKSLI